MTDGSVSFLFLPVSKLSLKGQREVPMSHHRNERTESRWVGTKVYGMGRLAWQVGTEELRSAFLVVSTPHVSALNPPPTQAQGCIHLNCPRRDGQTNSFKSQGWSNCGLKPIS